MDIKIIRNYVVMLLNKIWEVAREMKLKILEVAEERGMEQGMEQGIEQGVEISASIIRDLLENVPIEEIATRYSVEVDKVIQIQAALLG